MNHTFKILKKYNWLLILAILFYGFSLLVHKYDNDKLLIDNVKLKLDDFYKNQNKLVNTVFSNYNEVATKDLKSIGVIVKTIKSFDSINIYWNNNNYEFDHKLLNKKIDTSFLSFNDKKISEVHQKFIASKNETVQVVIPLQHQSINNAASIVNFEYLNKVFYLDTIAAYNYLKITAKPRLYINRNTSSLTGGYNNLCIILTCISFILFFIYIHKITIKISVHVSFLKAFLIVIFTLLTIRLCFYFLPFPLDVSKLSLFDPTIYASNKINKSLGDLLINIFFISWIFGFLRYHNFNVIRHCQAKFPTLVAFLHLLLFKAFTIVCIKVIQSIVLDSQIPLNALDFYSLDRFTIAAFAALSGLVFLYLRVTNLLFLHFANNKISFGLQLLLLGLVTIIFCIFNPQNLEPYLWVLLWQITYVFLLSTNWFKVSIAKKTFGLLLTSIVFFSFTCSTVLHNQINKLQVEQQYKVAERMHALIGLKEEFNLQGNSYSSVYNIGVYRNDTLFNYFGNYPFKQILLANTNTNKVFTNNIFYKTTFKNDGIDIVIIKANNNILLLITLFNYFIVCFFVMSFLVIIFPKLFLFKKEKYKTYFSLTIRSQILLIVVLALVSIYIVLATFTIRYFIKNFEKGIESNLVIQGNETAQAINSYFSQHDIDSVKYVNWQKELSSTIKNSTSFTLFDKHGISYYTSDTTINDKLDSKLLMNKMVLSEFKLNKPLYITTNERFNNLSYKSIYLTISKNNSCIGFIRLSFEKVEAYLQNETTGLIATLVNFSALFFLVIFIIVYYFANQLTNSLKIIGSKMNKININEINETIEWNRKDEIGVLVSQYNAMVLKLSESAKVLALTEREGAWKEMAKQVAHEIKNPLTPMKLSIQHLQYQIKQQPQKAEELTNKVVETLVQQIDQLAKIANDFSQFANITSVNAVKFDLNELINQLHQLYNGYDKVNFTVTLSRKNAIVFADKLQINRLFTNLFKNAIEASDFDGNENPTILVQQVIINTSVIVSICDNGKGIASEHVDNIFKPNFTTKSSGTGLGLAICKGIVDNAHGKIWFETTSNGTIFFVELPIAP